MGLGAKFGQSELLGRLGLPGQERAPRLGMRQRPAAWLTPTLPRYW